MTRTERFFWRRVGLAFVAIHLGAVVIHNLWLFS
jgi:hypothetical protein